jgi:hypothetical protein
MNRKERVKINWCVISFKFNFLAEAVFKTIPENRNGDIFLLHVGKPEGLSADFNDFGKATRVFEIKAALRHGQNLDRILIDKLYPEIIDCDWLVGLDHDIYIKDQEYLLRLITENCSPGNLKNYAIIACEDHWSVPGGDYVRYFLTTPMLLVNVRYPWNDLPSWDHHTIGEGDSQRYYDTGQVLAERLGKEKIKCFPEFPDHVLHHFFSEWQWMSDQHYKKNEYERFAESVSRTKTLLRDGFFVPSPREIPMMRQYAYFRVVLNGLAEEGGEWGNLS